MIFIFSQFYGVSFGCKANADQRDLGVQGFGDRWIPTVPNEPPVIPSFDEFCHFDEFYTYPNDFIVDCEREKRRMNIVEEAVQNILTDFRDGLATIFYADHEEAQGLAFSTWITYSL